MPDGIGSNRLCRGERDVQPNQLRERERVKERKRRRETENMMEVRKRKFECKGEKGVCER